MLKQYFEETLHRIRYEFMDGFWCIREGYDNWLELVTDTDSDNFALDGKARNLCLYICGVPTLENYDCF